MKKIERIPANARMSQAVIVNDIIYLKGVTPRAEAGQDITTQATDVLDQIRQMLQNAGSSIENLVAVNIWLKDIADMAALNKVYDAWVVRDQLPVRACVQADLAKPSYRIEVQVTAVRQ